MSAELHARIADEVRSASSDGRTVSDPQTVADIVLGMPELHAVRECISHLAALHYNDGYPAISAEMAGRLRAGLAVGGRLPESVIDWVLGDELRSSAEQTEVNQGEIVLNGRIYRRVHGTWMVRQHLGPDFVPVIQALGDALDEIEHLRTAGTALADAIHHADWCPASYSEGQDCDDQCGVAAAVTAWMRSGGHA